MSRRVSQVSVHFREQQEHDRLIFVSLLMGLQTVCLQRACLSIAPSNFLLLLIGQFSPSLAEKPKTQEEQSFYKFHENQEPAKGEQLWGLREKLQHKSKSHETWEEAHLSEHPAAGKHSNTAHILMHCKELKCTTQELRQPVFHHLWDMFPSFPSPSSPQITLPEIKAPLKLWHTEKRALLSRSPVRQWLEKSTITTTRLSGGWGHTERHFADKIK